MPEQEVSIGTFTSFLPEELRIAQEAVNLPEVQEMMKRLSKYNLGICMPHMHDDEQGRFQPLPQDMVQVETDLEVHFLKRSEAQKIPSVPVAWQWVDNGIESMAVCVSQCVPVHSQSGGDGHKTMHSH
jgi:hypothetical protein